MFSSLSRRRRRIWTVIILAGLFTVGSLVVWFWPSESSSYQPGQAVEGLTSSLDRSAPPEFPSVTFTEGADEAGIDFQHFSGSRTSQLPEDMGSGVAWIDYNNDGWVDLFVVNVAGPLPWSEAQIDSSRAHCALYRNEGDGTFTEVSERAGVDLRGIGMGVARGDYDNDGWTDLFVTTYGENHLLHNEGDGTFEEVSASAGIGDREGFWAGAAFGDYNRDGRLDLYVTGYVKYDPEARTQEASKQYDVETPASINPSTFPPERNLLYRNEGDGTFTEVSEQAGVADPAGRGLMATWADFTGDGRIDLYVANDVSDNRLYRNEGDGTFTDVSRRAHVADYRGAMGLAVGDWNVDQKLDLFVTHWLAQENALYTNLGRPPGSTDTGTRRPVQFMDQATQYGLGQVALDYVGWGTSFFDYDNDGLLDLFVVNGSTLEREARPTTLRPMPDLLFWNRSPDAGFFDASTVSGTNVFRTSQGKPLDRDHVGRGAAVADYDRDGDLDFFVVNHGGPGQLFRNEGGSEHHWLKVHLEGRVTNRSAIGARIRVVTGERVQVRQVGAQGSYLSQNSLIQHVGLGAHARVDTLHVQWPSGKTQTRTDVTVDQRVDLTEPVSSEKADADS